LFICGGTALCFFLFTAKKYSNEKRKNNVLFSGRTKSMTIKITEGLASGRAKKTVQALRYERRGFFALWDCGFYYSSDVLKANSYFDALCIFAGWKQHY
jgi:hypothetical protein